MKNPFKSPIENEFRSKDDWYDELVRIADKHENTRGVRDFEGWTSNWETETPDEAYYSEFPTHLNTSVNFE